MTVDPVGRTSTCNRSRQYHSLGECNAQFRSRIGGVRRGIISELVGLFVARLQAVGQAKPGPNRPGSRTILIISDGPTTALARLKISKAKAKPSSFKLQAPAFGMALPRRRLYLEVEDDAFAEGEGGKSDYSCPVGRQLHCSYSATDNDATPAPT